MTAPKAPNPVDKHVGSRVRMRRMQLGLTQEKLAAGLSVAFQQLQKYEKGINRISASRLQECANVLQVSPAFFFEGTPSALTSPSTVAETVPTPDYVTEFVTSRDGLALIKAFTLITDAKLRRSIVALAEEVVEY